MSSSFQGSGLLPNYGENDKFFIVIHVVGVQAKRRKFIIVCDEISKDSHCCLSVTKGSMYEVEKDENVSVLSIDIKVCLDTKKGTLYALLSNTSKQGFTFKTEKERILLPTAETAKPRKGRPGTGMQMWSRCFPIGDNFIWSLPSKKKDCRSVKPFFLHTKTQNNVVVAMRPGDPLDLVHERSLAT
jgi:hypothetical protein